LHGFRRTQKEIIHVVRICDVTLRKRFRISLWTFIFCLLFVLFCFVLFCFVLFCLMCSKKFCSDCWIFFFLDNEQNVRIRWDSLRWTHSQTIRIDRLRYRMWSSRICTSLPLVFLLPSSF
jgi:transcription initiation factor TFIIIB Brf1 subunit/transcription initiation factor TFIIB